MQLKAIFSFEPLFLLYYTFFFFDIDPIFANFDALRENLQY